MPFSFLERALCSPFAKGSAFKAAWCCCQALCLSFGEMTFCKVSWAERASSGCSAATAATFSLRERFDSRCNFSSVRPSCEGSLCTDLAFFEAGPFAKGSSEDGLLKTAGFFIKGAMATLKESESKVESSKA